MQPIQAQEGWFVLHTFYRVDRELWGKHRPEALVRSRQGLARMLESFHQGENCQARLYAILGHKADFGVMAIDPELNHLNHFENDFLAVFPPGVLQTVYSYMSMSEISEYVTQEKDYDRTLREKDGLQADSLEYQEKMEAYRERMRFYVKDRLFPHFPEHKVMCFYPMNKARGESKNWYTLDFDVRKQLMGGHMITGRKFAGKVKQLVTGSAGLDDWEWGVTLFSDDPYYLKKIVYDMRFDEVSAVYGEFGEFRLGVCLETEELLDRLKL